MIGIIGGTSLLSSALFADWREQTVESPYGRARLKTQDEAVFLQRHGEPPVPPHRINYRGNIWALRSLGVNKIISFNSTGSLRPELTPGTYLLPDDFFCPWQIPTFYDEEMHFTVPAMDTPLRDALFRLCASLSIPVVNGGIYVQTVGPRLETRAEIMALRQFGHLVGMTMASEATLCEELSIPYAAMCSIDNFANGIAEIPLTMEEIVENSTQGMKTFETVIRSLLEKGSL
jgi:5'-methylthioadenosine phosphorylase